MGCLPFYMYNNSDHRGLFIDIKTDFIDNKVQLKLPDKRHIGTNSTSKDKFSYKKFIDDQFRHQNIDDRTNNLLHMLTIKIKNEMANIINKLDTTITNIMITAERKCCKARHGSAWSVAVHTSSLLCKSI
jgi:hypothetical protein